MKKTLYLFIVLTFSVSSFAQKITENDLLGTWKLTAFESGGMTINYQTCNIILSEKMKEKYGNKAETFREMMVEELKKNKPKQQELFFEDGIKVMFQKEGDETLSWHYLIFEKEGVQYLHMNGGDFKITRDGKALMLSGEEGGKEILMTYERTSEKK